MTDRVEGSMNPTFVYREREFKMIWKTLLVRKERFFEIKTYSIRFNKSFALVLSELHNHYSILDGKHKVSEQK